LACKDGNGLGAIKTKTDQRQLKAEIWQNRFRKGEVL
jgi:hypothetical protein